MFNLELEKLDDQAEATMNHVGTTQGCEAIIDLMKSYSPKDKLTPFIFLHGFENLVALVDDGDGDDENEKAHAVSHGAIEAAAAALKGTPKKHPIYQTMSYLALRVIKSLAKTPGAEARIQKVNAAKLSIEVWDFARTLPQEEELDPEHRFQEVIWYSRT